MFFFKKNGLFIVYFPKNKKCKKSDNNSYFQAKHIFSKNRRIYHCIFKNKYKMDFIVVVWSKKTQKNVIFLSKNGRWALVNSRWRFFSDFFYTSIIFLVFFSKKKGDILRAFGMQKKAKKSQNPTSCTKLDGVFQKINFLKNRIY